jgi:hypothetical protein
MPHHTCPTLGLFCMGYHYIALFVSPGETLPHTHPLRVCILLPTFTRLILYTVIMYRDTHICLWKPRTHSLVNLKIPTGINI